jgi:TetR/AcrR family transcriptional regulator of autoinduction and epiphytic fitness
MPDPVTTVDGRTARALRTREAIVDACCALVDEGNLRPTAPRIAERAKVSVRSVFQHFDDLEGLYAAVADAMMERLSHLLMTVDPGLPVGRRIREVVHQRTVLLEAITPIRRAAAVHAPFSAEVQTRLQSGHDFLRSEIERLFATELGAVPAGDRVVLLDALDTVLSWPSWDNLRSLNGRSEAEACVVLERMVAALLPG